jgi:hypothetical protein
MKMTDDTIKLSCPTGLVVELYTDVELREKGTFERSEDYDMDTWDENVAHVVNRGPYNVDPRSIDVRDLQQQDWNHIRAFLVKRQEARDRAERMTLKYKLGRLREYRQRVVLATLTLGAHVFEGVLEGVEAAGHALRTNETHIPASPLRWHVERIKRAWKGK